MTESFIYDTYALMEILDKNPNYEQYTKKNMIINEFIFAEFCYQLIKDGIKDIEIYVQEIEMSIVKVTSKMIKDAMKFRYENKKKNVSMTDCISYIQSKELGVKFLTGDKEFEGMENVEFVK